VIEEIKRLKEESERKTKKINTLYYSNSALRGHLNRLKKKQTMENLTTLMCLDGKMNPIIFKDSTPEEINHWVLDNLDKLTLKEAFTCSVKLQGQDITIKGDKDDRRFIMTDCNVIDTKAPRGDCGCDEEEKKNCNNMLCIIKRNNKN